MPHDQIRKSEVERRLARELTRERFSTVIYAIGIFVCIAIIGLIAARFW